MNPQDLYAAIERALRSAGVLQLVNGYFLNEADEGARVPYLVLHLPSEDVLVRTNCSRYFRAMLRISAAHLSFNRAKALADNVVAALDDDGYTTTDGAVLCLYQDGRNYMEEVGFYRAIQSFAAVIRRDRVA